MQAQTVGTRHSFSPSPHHNDNTKACAPKVLQVNMKDTACSNFDLLDKVEQKMFRAPYLMHWCISFQAKNSSKL